MALRSTKAVFSLLAAGVASTLAISGAQAGGAGCVNCYRHVVTPPVYGTVAERVMVRAPRTVAHTVPGEYQTVSEKVMVAPARKVWQVTRDAHGHAVGCWVVVPAEYAVQHRRVMVRAPQVVHETLPAVYGTHQRTVLVSPGSSGWQPIGSGYGKGYGAGYGRGVGFGLGVAIGGAVGGVAGGVAAGNGY